tara:strand:- start:156 stop:548 length:393 start_codon:yes stop_codon:yes gene_type:complete
MELLNKIKADRMAARKERNTFLTKVLTTIVGEAETTIKAGRPYNTEALLIKFRKGLLETLAIKHSDEIAAEIAIINGYLPTELTREKIDSIIGAFPVDTSRGEIMSFFSKNYKGRFNGKLVNELVNQRGT